MKARNLFTVLLISGTLLNSCVDDANVDPLEELTKKQKEDQIQESSVEISDEEFYALIQSIPSPLTSSALMVGIGIEYQEELLQNTDKASEYSTWFSQGMNMGIYGADMGYSNVYGEMKTSMDYMGGIRELADKLKVGQFFDIATIQDLASKQDDVDALINTSQMNFQKMNDYLQQQKRGKVSVAMIMGGWVEGLYLSSSVASKNPDSEILREVVAEQKLALENIDMLLSLYAGDKYLKTLKADFDELKKAFEGIQMIYHEGETREYEDDEGNLIVEDSSTTEIVINNDDVKKILAQVTKMRKGLINLK